MAAGELSENIWAAVVADSHFLLTFVLSE